MCNQKSNAAFDTLRLVPWTLEAMHPSAARLYEAAHKLRKTVGQSNVARLLNETPQTVKNWEARGISDGGAIKAEGVIGCRAHWLVKGEGRMADGADGQPCAGPTPLPDALAALAGAIQRLTREQRQALQPQLAALAQAPDSADLRNDLAQALAPTAASVSPTQAAA